MFATGDTIRLETTKLEEPVPDNSITPIVTRYDHVYERTLWSEESVALFEPRYTFEILNSSNYSHFTLHWFALFSSNRLSYEAGERMTKSDTLAGTLQTTFHFSPDKMLSAAKATSLLMPVLLNKTEWMGELNDIYAGSFMGTFREKNGDTRAINWISIKDRGMQSLVSRAGLEDNGKIYTNSEELQPKSGVLPGFSFTPYVLIDSEYSQPLTETVQRISFAIHPIYDDFPYLGKKEERKRIVREHMLRSGEMANFPGGQRNLQEWQQNERNLHASLAKTFNRNTHGAPTVFGASMRRWNDFNV
jgi:hypothetical protein